MKQEKKFFFDKKNLSELFETLDKEKMQRVTGGDDTDKISYSRELPPPTYTESTYVRKR